MKNKLILLASFAVLVTSHAVSFGMFQQPGDIIHDIRARVTTTCHTMKKMTKTPDSYNKSKEAILIETNELLRLYNILKTYDQSPYTFASYAPIAKLDIDNFIDAHREFALACGVNEDIVAFE